MRQNKDRDRVIYPFGENVHKKQVEFRSRHRSPASAASFMQKVSLLQELASTTIIKLIGRQVNACSTGLLYEYHPLSLLSYIQNSPKITAQSKIRGLRALAEPFLVFLNELVSTLVSNLIRIPLDLEQIAVVEGVRIEFKYFVAHDAHFVEVEKTRDDIRDDVLNKRHHLKKHYEAEGLRVMQQFEEILRKKTVQIIEGESKKGPKRDGLFQPEDRKKSTNSQSFRWQLNEIYKQRLDSIKKSIEEISKKNQKYKKKKEPQSPEKLCSETTTKDHTLQSQRQQLLESGRSLSDQSKHTYRMKVMTSHDIEVAKWDQGQKQAAVILEMSQNKEGVKNIQCPPISEMSQNQLFQICNQALQSQTEKGPERPEDEFICLRLSDFGSRTHGPEIFKDISLASIKPASYICPQRSTLHYNKNKEKQEGISGFRDKVRMTKWKAEQMIRRFTRVPQ